MTAWATRNTVGIYSAGPPSMWRLIASVALTATMLAVSSADASPVDFRVTVGLPRVSNVDGSARAWRQVGLVAETDWADVEVKVPACVMVNPGSGRPGPSPGPAGCVDPNVDVATVAGGYQYAVTFKLPQWNANGPLVDVALRQMQAASQVEDVSLRIPGLGADITLTQPVGNVDLLSGLLLPVTSGNLTAGGRSAFAGIAWQLAPGTSLTFIVDASEQAWTGARDRALTVRFIHLSRAKSVRLAAWATRAEGDGFGPWRAGLGLEYTY